MSVTMVYIILLVGGILVGGVIEWLLAQSRISKVSSQLLLEKQKTDSEHQRVEEQRQLVDKAAAESERLRSEIDAISEQLTQARLALTATQTELASLRESSSKESRMRQEQFDQQLATIREQFANIAASVLTQTSDRLKDTGRATMTDVTKPLMDNLRQLQDAINNTNTASARNTASLTQQLKNMGEQTEKTARAASMLTDVIRGGAKTQGKWGERMLTELLETQGFVQGQDFDVQQTITDSRGKVVLSDDGKRLIPDVVVHYPYDEDIIIDSKMPIEAYYNYVNAESDADKQRFADELVRNIRTQVKNLAGKNYSSYIKPPRHAIDFVVMFVPNEGVVQLAMSRDSRIWAEAFDKNVYITGPQNLVPMLRIIRIAWRQYQQAENQERVFGLAQELLKRVGEFLSYFNATGDAIKKANEAYEHASKKLNTGKQSIVQKATQMKSLGVKEDTKYVIPAPEPDPSEEELAVTST